MGTVIPIDRKTEIVIVEAYETPKELLVQKYGI
jgi:hypothetical protein